MGEFRKFDKGRGDRRSGGNSFGGPRKFGNRDDAPRQMHTATCSQCGKSCQIPFKPVMGRPVYCSDCFKNQKTGFNPNFAPKNFGGDSFEKPAPQFNVGSNAGGGVSKAQFDALNAKLDKVIALLNASTKTPEAPKLDLEVEEPKTKKAATKKAKAVVKKSKSKKK